MEICGKGYQVCCDNFTPVYLAAYPVSRSLSVGTHKFNNVVVTKHKMFLHMALACRGTDCQCIQCIVKSIAIHENVLGIAVRNVEIFIYVYSPL